MAMLFIHVVKVIALFPSRAHTLDDTRNTHDMQLLYYRAHQVLGKCSIFKTANSFKSLNSFKAFEDPF